MYPRGGDIFGEWSVVSVVAEKVGANEPALARPRLHNTVKVNGQNRLTTGAVEKSLNNV